MSQYGAEGYALHGADYRAILAHYYSGTALGAISPQRTVRVLLATGRASFSGATVAGAAGSALTASGGLAAGAIPLQPGVTYTVAPAPGGRLQLRTSTGKSAGTFSPPLVVSGPGPLTVPGLGSYRGTLEFSPAGGGVATVNAVGLDDYLRGVVAEEMSASWAPAALKAQAVAARTYAITTTVGAGAYDLYDDSRSQMYGGAGAETAATDAAVAATSGQIVTYGGQPAVTYFYASSGGYTESIQNAWPGASPEPWLRGVPDPYDGAAGDPYHSWGAQMSVAAAAATLGGLVRGSLVGITVVRHGVSGRIMTADVVGTRGQTTVTGCSCRRSSAWTRRSPPSPPSPRRTRAVVWRARSSRPRRASVAIQVAAGGRWKTIRWAAVSAAGRYGTQVPAGRYRIVYGALDGPTVTVP